MLPAMQRRAAAWLMAGLVAVGAAPLFAQAPSDDALDAAVGEAMRTRQIAGVAIAVLRNGNLVIARAWGAAKPGEETARADTIFFLDSTTKQLTAAAIMLLVQDGAIALDDPVRKYLPEAPPSWEPIRIRHLLTHTAGLAHDAPHYEPIPVQNCRPEAILRFVFQLRPQWPPGSKYAYSNAGFDTLAALIERATGGCYFQFLERRIFAPLGMQRTRLAEYPAQREPGHARGYRATPSGIRIAPQPPHALGGGGIASTVLDLARWDAALDGTAILSEASKSQMWTPAVLDSGRKIGYGFGWELGRTPIGRLVHHNGGGFGFDTAFYRYVDAGLTVIVLTNTVAQPQPPPANNGDAIARRIASMYEPRLRVAVSARVRSTLAAAPAASRESEP